MTVIVVPVDGSQGSMRALEIAIALAGRDKDSELRILNVQPEIPSSVGSFVGGGTVRGHYEAQAEKAFAAARDVLKQSGISHRFDFRAGAAGEVIAGFARETGADHIVMGTRGLGAVKGLLLGSVAIRVAQLAPCPVTLVK